MDQRVEEAMDEQVSIQSWDADLGCWRPAVPLPFYAPPRLRSLLWAWLTRRPRPEWRAVSADPNPTERRWRRG